MEVCRIWWPQHLDERQCGALLGWINLYGRSADLVVAAVVEISVLDLDGSFTRRRWRLPAVEECCGEVCVLGLCGADENLPELEQRSKRKVWMTCSSTTSRNGFSVPSLCSITLLGKSCSPKVHFVRYSRPRHGSHHFSLEPWNFFPSCSRLLKLDAAVNCVKKPYWILELEQQDRGPSIALVTQQLNCAGFLDATTTRTGEVSQNTFENVVFVFCGIAAALLSVYYAAARVWFVASSWSNSVPLVNTAVRSSSTYQSIHIRFLEFSSWPSVFFWSSDGPRHPNVAIYHRLTLTRHFMLFRITVDIVLGSILGIVVLVFQNTISSFIVALSCSLTNDVLRTGCIWLMGVPAGFKLNNELAEVMGTAALNLTQAYLTVLELLPASFRLLQCLGAVSVFLGASVSTSALVDALFVTTAHIRVLQRAAAFIYGNQLKLLAALWRMFRGRKFNPLRNRIDSYEYSVEELVVASLMFTPLLLLLPTTSVFYTFFTILHASLSVPGHLLQITVELTRTFPYIEIWQWIIARKRLPSGLVFHLDAVSNDAVVSRVNSRLATLEEIVMPYFRQLLSEFNYKATADIAFNLASGGSLPVSFRSGLCLRPLHSTVICFGCWDVEKLKVPIRTLLFAFENSGVNDTILVIEWNDAEIVHRANGDPTRTKAAILKALSGLPGCTVTPPALPCSDKVWRFRSLADAMNAKEYMIAHLYWAYGGPPEREPVARVFLITELTRLCPEVVPCGLFY